MGGEGWGIALAPLARQIEADALRYRYVVVQIDRARRTATFTVQAPGGAPPRRLDDIVAAGADWWPLALARELDDAILSLRSNEPEIGLWLLKTEGDSEAVLAADATLARHSGHWFVRETIGMVRRTLARLVVSSRTLFALIEPGSCFAGTLLELALAADRSYMLDAEGNTLALSELNFGTYPRVDGLSRIGFSRPPAGRSRGTPSLFLRRGFPHWLEPCLGAEAPRELDPIAAEGSRNRRPQSSAPNPLPMSPGCICGEHRVT